MMDYYGFYTGQEFEAYTYPGAHVNGNGVMFRTYAPKADRVSLIGEFSGWKELPMNKVYDGQFYELNVPEAGHGQMYKYRIYHADGKKYIDHCDPYGFWAELRPEPLPGSMTWEDTPFRMSGGSAMRVIAEMVR